MRGRFGSKDQRRARARRGAGEAASANRRRRCPECGRGGRVRREPSSDGFNRGFSCGWCNAQFDRDDMRRMEALKIEFGKAGKSVDGADAIAVNLDGVHMGSITEEC